MKKISLIPLAAAFLTLSVSGTISSNLGATPNMCTVTVDFDGGHSKSDSTVTSTTFSVREGTLWKYAKKLAPAHTDIEYNDYRVMQNDGDFSEAKGTLTGTQTKIADTYVVRNDVTIYPIYFIKAEDKVTVNWVNANGTPLSSETYVKLDTPSWKGDDPEIDEGTLKVAGHTYDFDGWYPEISQIAGGSGSVDPITYTATYTDVTEIEVVFDLNYDGNKNYSSVTFNDTITKPTDPTRDGYTFEGWFESATPADDDESFDFDNTPADSALLGTATTFTLYAKWTDSHPLTVDVDPNGGKFNDGATAKRDVQNVKVGTKWSEVPDTCKVSLTDSSKWPVGAKEVKAYRYDFSGNETEITADFTFTVDTHIVYKYTFTKTTVQFDPLELSGASTLPSNIPNIEYGTKWKDIKVEPTNVADGYTFLYFCQSVTSGDPVIVTDDFTFDGADGTSYTFFPVYEVKITFENNSNIGLIDYKDIKVKTTETWANYKAGFVPTIVDSQYSFDKVTRLDGDPAQDTDLIDSYKFCKSETFKIHYKNASADSFTNDSWEIFLNYINGKTIDDLKAENEPYSDEYASSTGKAANTFVGLTREVVLSDGNSYTVRVIDEAVTGSNTLTDGGLFTFEFEDMVDTKVIFDTEVQTYEDSNLAEYLGKTLIHMFPNTLKSRIEDVDKTIFSGHNSSTLDVETTTASFKLFPLSVSEYGFTGTYPDAFEEDILNEGNAYAYYKAGTPAGNRQKSVNNSSVSYWTRSLDITADMSSYSFAWAINPTGTLGVSSSASLPTEKMYVAPAFVIK